MTEVAYACLVLPLLLAAAAFGFVAHFVRSIFGWPEQIYKDDDTLSDELNRIYGDRNYRFEKYVVHAKWDERGRWERKSTRNLVYMMVWGTVPIIFTGILFWPMRARFVAAACAGLLLPGVHLPLC